MEDIMRLCDVIRETGFAIHRYHKHGHLEKVYENALAHRLRKLGLDVKQQYPLKVYDEDGTLIGDYSADLLVDMGIIAIVRVRRANWAGVAEQAAEDVGEEVREQGGFLELVGATGGDEAGPVTEECRMKNEE